MDEVCLVSDFFYVFLFRSSSSVGLSFASGLCICILEAKVKAVFVTTFFLYSVWLHCVFLLCVASCLHFGALMCASSGVLILVAFVCACCAHAFWPQIRVSCWKPQKFISV